MIAICQQNANMRVAISNEMVYVCAVPDHFVMPYDPWGNLNIVGQIFDLIPFHDHMFEIVVVLLLLVIIWLLWKRRK